MKMYTISRSVLRQLITCLVCNILIIDNGFHEGWVAPMLSKFGKGDTIAVTSSQSALLINLLYIGTGVSSIFLFFVMNRIGRKTILLCASVPKMISWLLLGLGNTYTIICIGRFLAGLSHGVTFTIISIYQCEITSKNIRGVVGTVMSNLANISVLIIYGVIIWISQFSMSIIALVIQLCFFSSFIFAPESPYFLVRNNDEARARQTLAWLLDREDVQKELEEVKRFVAMEDALVDINMKTRLVQVFAKRENRRAMLIGTILAVALIWCGGSAILGYQSYVYRAAGFGHFTNLSIMLTGISNVVAGFMCTALIQKLGKRLILLISIPVICCSMTIVALFFVLQDRGFDVRQFNWLPTVCFVLYIFTTGFSLVPLVFIYMGEIFPYEMKAPAVIFFDIFYSVSTVGLIECYQSLQKYGTHAPFWFFAIVSGIVWTLIFIYVPETEDKSLEEILIELQSRNKKLTQSNEAETKNVSNDGKYNV